MRRYYKRRGSGGGWTLFPWSTRQESFSGSLGPGRHMPRLVLVPAWGMRSGHAGKVVAAQLDWRGLRFGGRVLVGVGQGMCRRWPGATPAWTPEDQPHRDPDRGPEEGCGQREGSARPIGSWQPPRTGLGHSGLHSHAPDQPG